MYSSMLYAVGGLDGALYLNTVERFDGSRWVSAPSMASKRYGAAVAVHSSVLYAVGGSPDGSTTFSTVERFDGSVWASAPSMASKRSGLGVAVF